MPTPRRMSVSRELRTIGRSLESIVGALGRLAPALKAVERRAQPAASRPRRKPSPKRLAALKLQGQYMGHVRNLRPRQKARVKALRGAKGIDAAIRLAKAAGRLAASRNETKGPLRPAAGSSRLPLPSRRAGALESGAKGVVRTMSVGGVLSTVFSPRALACSHCGSTELYPYPGPLRRAGRASWVECGTPAAPVAGTRGSAPTPRPRSSRRTISASKHPPRSTTTAPLDALDLDIDAVPVQPPCTDLRALDDALARRPAEPQEALSRPPLRGMMGPTRQGVSDEARPIRRRNAGVRGRPAPRGERGRRRVARAGALPDPPGGDRQSPRQGRGRPARPARAAVGRHGHEGGRHPRPGQRSRSSTGPSSTPSARRASSSRAAVRGAEPPWTASPSRVSPSPSSAAARTTSPSRATRCTGPTRA